MKQSERKQLAIIEAATQVFIEDGYVSASMKKIAEVANISKRTLYKYFPSKEAVFTTVLSNLADKVHEKAGRPYRANEPLNQQLDYIIRGKIASMQDPIYRQLAKVTLPIGLAEHALFKQVATNLIYKSGPLINWLEEVKTAGLLNTDDTLFIGNLIQGMLEKYVFWPQLLNLEEEVTPQATDRLVNIIIDIFNSQFVKQTQ